MSIISCVALFYKAGKGGKDFSRKEKFRVECPKNEDGTEIKLKDLKELICQFGGICTVARDVGLGEELDLRIGRLDSRCDRYSMNTDAQVRLEMPRIREGIDKLQVLVYPVELIFSPKKAHIVIEVSGEYNSSQVKKQTPSTAKRSKSLSDKEKRELEEELKKLKESKLIEDQSVMARTRTGARVHWPWRIECGQCHVGLLLRYDANTSGRIRRFRNGISLFKIFILTRAISDC